MRHPILKILVTYCVMSEYFRAFAEEGRKEHREAIEKKHQTNEKIPSNTVENDYNNSSVSDDPFTKLELIGERRSLTSVKKSLSKGDRRLSVTGQPKNYTSKRKPVTRNQNESSELRANWSEFREDFDAAFLLNRTLLTYDADFSNDTSDINSTLAQNYSSDTTESIPLFLIEKSAEIRSADFHQLRQLQRSQTDQTPASTPFYVEVEKIGLSWPAADSFRELSTSRTELEVRFSSPLIVYGIVYRK